MDNAESLGLAFSKLEDYMALNSMRNTQERVAMLELLYSNDTPFVPAEVCRLLSEDRRMIISRATVYNNLKLFENAGLVRRIFVGGQVLYERTDRKEGTISLVCGGCGKAVAMTDARVMRMIGEMRTRRFVASGWSLNVYGLCGKCSAALKRKQNKLMNKTIKTKNENRKD